MGLSAWPLSQGTDTSFWGSGFGLVSLVNRVVLGWVVGEEGLLTAMAILWALSTSLA